MSILNEDIKNTRFLLTLAGIGALLSSFLGVLILILRGTAIDSNLQTVLVMIITAIASLVGTSYNSYFKDRQAAQAQAQTHAQVTAEAQS